MTNIYALYKGDTFLDIGTVEELAKKYKVKKETIYYYRTPANQRKNKGKRRTLIKIEGD